MITVEPVLFGNSTLLSVSEKHCAMRRSENSDSVQLQGDELLEGGIRISDIRFYILYFL